MGKLELLNELKHHTLVALKPSKVQGIGVFAMVDISKGQRNIFSKDQSEWIRIPKSEIAELPLHSKDLVENFCLYDEGHYYVPEYGFKMVDLVIYLNHDENPNIASINEGEDFEALRDIRAGEELFIDYSEIVDH